MTARTLRGKARLMPAGTLSERAKGSLETLFMRTWRAAMVPEGESAEVLVLKELPPKLKERKAVVLSVSTYALRALVVLHFKFDTETRAHFARLNRAEPEGWSEEAFADALAECGNMCVGAMNRSLGEVFEHIGMSTPNTIDRAALGYLEALGTGHVRQFELRGLAQPYYATLCVLPYETLDFQLEFPAEDEMAADSGEMEMF